MDEIDLSVRNPFTHNTWEKGRFTDYEIAIQTDNKAFCLQCSTTRRRYKEFEWLQKCLKSHHPLETPPQLPPKKFFGERFDPTFIAFRMKGLEEYLKLLLKERLYLSDVAVHLFLQTNLTTAEIDKVLIGEITSEVIDEVWRHEGNKCKCSFFNKNNSRLPEENLEVTLNVSGEMDSLSGSDSRSNDSDLDSSDIDYPPLSLVLPHSASIGNKIHNTTDIHNACNEDESSISSQTLKEQGNAVILNNDTSYKDVNELVDHTHSINCDTNHPQTP